MNDMAKNLILWLIIAAVLVTVMNNFTNPSEPQTLNYSDFIQQVKDGGYIVVGGTTSIGDSTSDVLLLKLDAQGDEEWYKVFNIKGQ